MIIEVIKGLLLGMAVSAFNNLLAVRVLGKAKAGGSKAKIRIGAVFFFRFLVNFLTLFLVYKNPPMLIGTGFGLVVVTHLIVFKNYKRKG